ncbi:MAG: hypothetical protein RR222_23310 [Pseudomonas sp.]|uniref:hypothetical protein n=1 Tax=Pseudomonas sp. TaxID=306 RepID=UPI002FCC655D
MKKALLILMMFLLPLQSLIAAERNFAHVMEGYNTYGIGFVAKHMTEHSSEILHHHDLDDAGDDDGDVHLDDSQKSSRHLSDFEHGNSMNLLFPPPFQLPLVLDIRITPEAFLDTFSDRATLPLLRPPRSPV